MPRKNSSLSNILVQDKSDSSLSQIRVMFRPLCYLGGFVEALTAIQTRNSVSRLSGKVSQDDLEQIISSGLRAPDHGMLRPWSIKVIQGESLKKLGKLFLFIETLI